jgi:hypothetical protein
LLRRARNALPTALNVITPLATAIGANEVKLNAIAVAAATAAAMAKVLPARMWNGEPLVRDKATMAPIIPATPRDVCRK